MVCIMKTSTNKIMAFLVSLLISALFFICCFEIPAVQAAISAKGNINLLAYAMTIILFLHLLSSGFTVSYRKEQALPLRQTKNSFGCRHISFSWKSPVPDPYVPVGN